MRSICRLLIIFLVAAPVGLVPNLPEHQTLERIGDQPSPIFNPQSRRSILSESQAIARAFNKVTAVEGGYQLNHPEHDVRFSALGIAVAPLVGPKWSWSAESAVAGRPEYSGKDRIIYQRQGYREEYLLKQNSIEQLFVFEKRPAGTIELSGTISSEGEFLRQPYGWSWKNEDGEVTLGNVYAYDARGTPVNATMDVDQTSTRIVILEEDLDRAVFPLTIDPEIGTNDFRISTMGIDGDVATTATYPSVAYNVTYNTYLVVWEGNTGSETEIWGHLINAATGASIATDYQISFMGAGTSFEGFKPDVASSGSTGTEFMVTWYGDDVYDGAYEIHVQRINANTGALVGSDIRISTAGATDSDVTFAAFYPAIAFNDTDDRYYVVWYGDDDSASPTPTVDGEYEIFGQLLSSTGSQTGFPDDDKISDLIGAASDPLLDATSPDVAWDATDNLFMVAWEADDDTSPQIDNEIEIFIQRIDGATAAELGTDIRISDMGPNGDGLYDAGDPAIAWNSVNNRFLVVWQGDDDTGSLVDNEFEIYGQLMTNLGAETGTNDLRLSDMGTDGLTTFNTYVPQVDYDPNLNQFLVVWYGDDNIAPLVDNEYEVFGQFVTGAGAVTGTNDFRLSDMGVNGATTHNGFLPAITYNSTPREHVIVWYGDNNFGSLVDNEYEIWGQRYADAETEPTNSPTSIVFSSITTTSQTLSWTAAVGGADNYLVLRQTSNPSNTPTDQVGYTAGATIGSATVAYSGSATTFNDTGLSPGVLYYYDIFSFNGQNSSSNYRITSPLEGNHYVLAAEPTTQSTSIVFSGVLPQQQTATWTIGNGANRIVIVDDAAITFTPVDGTSYAANTNYTLGTDLGSGQKCVYAGSGNSVNVTNLNPNTIYYYRVYEVNGVAAQAYNYYTNTASGNPASRTTLQTKPTVQASNIVFSSITQTAMTLSFTAGDGTNRLVLGHAGVAVDSPPVDGTTYTASATFGSGNQIGSGNYVVYNSTGTGVTVTGLTAGTTYHFKVYEYNGTGGAENFMVVNNTNNPNSQSTMFTEPVTQASSLLFSNVTATSMDITFTTGSGTERLVIARPTSSISFTPVDGTGYTANSDYSSGVDLGSGHKAVYSGASNGFTVTGLTPGTLHYFRVYEFNGSGVTANYNVFTATGNPSSRTTLAADPGGQPTSMVFSGVGPNSMTVGWTAAAGPPTGYLVLRKTGSSPSDVPVDGTTYSAGGSIGTSSIVYVGAATSFADNTVSAATMYYYDVFSYNGSVGTFNYLTTSPLEGNHSTLSTIPPNSPTALTFSSVTVSSINVSYTASAGGADGYIVMRKAGSAPTDIPVDESDYVAGNIIGTSTVAYVGAGTSFNDTGLSTNTVYFYAVYAYNGTAPTTNYRTADPLQGSRSTLAAQPGFQPTGFTPSLVTSSSFTVTYSAASGSPAGYIAFRRAGVNPTDVPVDGTEYIVGNTVGSSTVAYVGSALTFNESGLSSGITYYYDIFSYNGTTDTYNYLTTSPLEGNVTTVVAEPTVQATNILFSAVTATSIDLSWTNGTGTGRIVIARATNPIATDPIDGITYTGGAYGAGTAVGAGFVVYNGSGNTTSVTGLSASTVYYFKVYEYNGSGASSNYLIAGDAGNPANRSTLAAEPTAQPTSLLFGSITATGFSVSYTAAVGSPAGYLVLRRAGSAVSPDAPADGSGYVAGNTVGSSTVAYVGSALTFNETTLSAGTVYHYALFSYNGATNTYNYLTTSPLIGSQSTLAAEPTVQANSITFTSPTTSSVTINWTSGNGGNRIVIVDDAVITFTPTDGTSYTANTNYGAGTDLGSGQKCVYNSSGSSVAITGLSVGTVYHVRIYEYNGAGALVNYYNATATNNPNNRSTLVAEPTAQPTGIGFASVTSSSFTVSFAAAAPPPSGGYFALRRAGSAVADVPVDGSNYIAGNTIGSSTVAFIGTGTSFPQSGLSSGVTYHYAIFSYNGTTDSYNYLTTSPATGNQTTTVVEPTAQPTLLTFSNIGTTTIDLSWTAATGSPAGYLVMRRQGASSTFVPADGTTYSVSSTQGDGVVAYSGGGTSFTDAGLSANTVYFYDVFSFNGSGVTTNYLTTSPLEGSRSTIQAQPTNQPTSLVFSNVTASSIDVSFTAASGSPSGYLVLMRSGASPTGAPTDGISYSPAAVIGDGTVVYTGSGTSFSVSSLTAGTVYHFDVFSYNGSGGIENYLTTSPLEGNRTTLASEPGSQPSGLLFSLVTTTSFDVSFSAASGSPAGYIAFRRTGTSPTDIPVDGTVYSVGNAVGTSTVAYVGSGTSFSETGLNPGTVYAYDLFSYNGATASDINYLTTSPLEGSRSTLQNEPTAQITALTFSNLGSTSMDVSYSAAVGNPDGYLVVIRTGSSPTAIPIDGTAYTVGAPLGDGIIAYAGGALTFSSLSLTPSTEYFYDVFSFNGSGESINYLTTGPFEGSRFSLANAPSSQPTNIVFSAVTATSFTVSFTSTGAGGYIAVRRAGSSPTGIPQDGSSYAVNDALGDGTIVLFGNSNTFNQTGLTAGTVYHYDIYAFNATNTSDVNYLTTGFPLEGSQAPTASGTDTTPPVMSANSTPSSVSPGSQVVVSATYTDPESTVTGVQLEYRSIAGSSTFVSVAMTLTSGSWQFTIPSGDVGELGIEYNMIATNSVPLTSTQSSLRVRIEHSGDGLTIPYSNFGNQQTNYSIISLPLDLTSKSVSSVLVDDIGEVDRSKWRLYRYQGTSTSELGSSSNLDAGKGYWLIIKDSGVTLDTGPGTTTSATVDQPYVISLSAGWNQIGNPYNFNVSWSDIMSLNGNPSEVTKFRVYNGGFQDGTVLNKFSGGFVMASSSFTLKIPVTKNASVNGRSEAMASSQLRNSLDQDSWEVLFEIESGGLTYNLGGIGMRPDASVGYDKYDDFTLPRFGEFVELSHEKSFLNIPYSRDVLPRDEQGSWEFVVHANVEARETVIKWDNSYFGDSHQSLVLWDAEAARPVDMKLTTEYIIPGNSSRSFKVYYGTSESVAKELTAGSLRLVSMSPNPANGPVVFTIAIPDGIGGEQSELALFDMSGRRIVTLSGYFNPGYHDIEWSGEDENGRKCPSGMYAVRLRAGKASVSKKLLISR